VRDSPCDGDTAANPPADRRPARRRPRTGAWRKWWSCAVARGVPSAISGKFLSQTKMQMTGAVSGRQNGSVDGDLCGGSDTYTLSIKEGSNRQSRPPKSW
jgi:hypothetical protein